MSALVEAVRESLRQVMGPMASRSFMRMCPEFLSVRAGEVPSFQSEGEHFLASDVSAIVAHTREAVYLNDYEIVSIRADGFDISTLAGSDASFQVSKVEFQAEDVDKGAFRITCSRRSLSSRTRFATPCVGVCPLKRQLPSSAAWK